MNKNIRNKMKSMKRWAKKYENELWHILWLLTLAISYVFGSEKDILYIGFAAILCYLHGKDKE